MEGDLVFSDAHGPHRPLASTRGRVIGSASHFPTGFDKLNLNFLKKLVISL